MCYFTIRSFMPEAVTGVNLCLTGGTKINSVILRLSTTSTMYGVESSILFYREDMHNTLVLSSCRPIFISFLRKMCCSYRNCALLVHGDGEGGNLGEAST